MREGRLPPRKEGETMYSCDDPYADLDDLIFEKGDGGPSERRLPIHIGLPLPFRRGEAFFLFKLCNI